MTCLIHNSPLRPCMKPTLLVAPAGQKPNTINPDLVQQAAPQAEFSRQKRNPHRTGLMRCRLIAVSPMRILQASSRVLEEAPRRLRSGTSFAFAPLLDLRGIQSPPFPPPNVGESVRVVQHHLTELHEGSCAPDFPFRRASAKVALGWWTARGPRRYRGESSPFGLSMLLRRTTSVGLLQCTSLGS